MQLICEGHSQVKSMSQGMRIVLNRPTILGEPVLQGGSDVDAVGATIYGSVIRDGGVFRMWYQAWPRNWNGEDVITVGCVESDDGLDWRRPKYGLVECMGTKANQLTDLPFHSPSVIIDPDADPTQRYRAFGYADPAKFMGRFPGKVNGKGYFTAHSADGLHWDLDSPEPLWSGADVITSVWDPVSRCARAVLKTGRCMGGLSRRAFSSAEWRKGQASEPVSSLFPDDYDDISARARGFNSADYYGVGLMPTEGPTIGFLWNFRHQLPLGHDSKLGGNWGSCGCVDLSIVYQLERGGCWRHVTGRPDWLSTSEAPEWARGVIYTAAYPLEVGEETWLYFCGTIDRHGACGVGVQESEFYKNATAMGGFSKIGLAKWIRGRIIGCQADLVERISLTARKSDSSRLALNAVMQPGGRIRVQLVDAGGNPIKGYGYDDCDPMAGDLRDLAVRWRGKDTLPVTPAIAEVEITRGTLYAFDYTFDHVLCRQEEEKIALRRTATPPPQVRVRRSPKGAAGDPLKVDWCKAVPAGEWFTQWGYSGSRKMEACLMQDGDYLYLRLTDDSKTGSLVCGPNIWDGDDWEMLFALKHGAYPYRQIAINPEGGHAGLGYGESSDKWESGVSVISKTAADSWTVSLGFPLSRLVPGGLKPGQTVYVNLMRSYGGKGDNLFWSPTFDGSFHSLDRMGEIILE